MMANAQRMATELREARERLAQMRGLEDVVRSYVVAVSRAPHNRDEIEVDMATAALVNATISLAEPLTNRPVPR
jgi:hypothetical protein